MLQMQTTSCQNIIVVCLFPAIASSILQLDAAHWLLSHHIGVNKMPVALFHALFEFQEKEWFQWWDMQQLWILSPNSPAYAKWKKGEAAFQSLASIKCQHWFIHYLHKACIDLLLPALVEVVNTATDHPPMLFCFSSGEAHMLEMMLHICWNLYCFIYFESLTFSLCRSVCLSESRSVSLSDVNNI